MNVAVTSAAGAPPLETLLRRYPGCLWRGEDAIAPGGIPAGHAALRQLLPGGVWPSGTLVEVICRGAGEEGPRLFFPAMRHVAGQGKYIGWIRPPHPAYGPALASAGLDAGRNLILRSKTEPQNLWALEQLLQSPECGLALSWPGNWSIAIGRRLRLAAARGGGLGVVFLRETRTPPFSFATLRLALRPAENGLVVRILKAPAGRGRESVLRGI